MLKRHTWLEVTTLDSTDILGWPKDLFGFFCKTALVALVFNFIQDNFVRLYYDSSHISVHLKNQN